MSLDDQQAINDAFDDWRDQFVVDVAGCGVTPTDISAFTAPDQLTGGTVTITYSAADSCTNDEVTASFTIDPASGSVDVDGPENVSNSACLYVDQQAINDAFDDWRDLFIVVESGCGVTPTDISAFTAPDQCLGGIVEITFAASDKNTSDQVTASFEILPAEQITVTGPDSVDAQACDYTDADALTDAYNAWIAAFSVDQDGCNAVGSFTSAPPATVNYCADTDITLTYTAADNCTNASVTRTFKVDAAPAVTVTGPDSVDAQACDYTDADALTDAYNAWIAAFSVDQDGCNAVGSFTSAPPTTINYCANTDITLTYTAADNCNNASVTRTFKVDAAPAVDVSGPPNINANTCEFDDQQAINDAFDDWRDQFVVDVAGCGVTPTDISAFTAPDQLTGGTVTITYSAADSCTNDEVTASFTIDPASDVNVVGPENVSNNACLYADQQAINDAFDDWRDLFIVVESGCGVTSTDISAFTAPDQCLGGIVEITFSASDKNTSDEVTASFEILAPTPVTFDQNTLPQDDIVECDNIPDAEELTASNACGKN